MIINYQAFEKNEPLKQLVKDNFKLNDSVKIDLFSNSLVALNDITRGIADLHPHKRSIATLGALPPPLREIIRGFAKQGFVVQEIPWSMAVPAGEQKINMISFLDTLKKDTLFVLGCDIEPFTGAYFPWNLIKDDLFKRGIFSINYQSPASLKSGLKSPMTGMEAVVVDPLWGATESISFVIKGERCAGEPLMWGDAVFSRKVILKAFEIIKSASHFGHHEENIILNFERALKAMLGDSIGILPLACQRLYDRAVIFAHGAGGDSIVKVLAEKGVMSSTADACFWDEPHMNSWLPKLGLTLEDAQSSVIIPLEEIKKNEKLLSILSAVIGEIQKKSKA